MSDRAIASALNSSLQSLGSCNLSLKQATASLEASVSDFPRLRTVLNHDRCFELVTATDLRRAQNSVASQIQPHIEELLQKAEAAMSRLEQKHRSLNAQAHQAQERHETLQSAQALQAKLAKLRAEKEQLTSALKD